MASDPSSPGASTPQPPAEKPSAPPVNILSSPLARVYSIVHPALLLALGATQFEPLVANPTKGLLTTLPWLTLIQISYVIICLPPQGQRRRARPPRASRALAHPDLPRAMRSTASPALLALALTFVLATPILAVLLVLFGAPLTTHNAETVLGAAHMAVLSATALIYTHGLDRSVWNEVWGIARPADAVWGSALGTGLGAWFGAIPIPLDWDRPWQAFPITILTGAYIGYAVGSFVSRTPLVFGKRIVFTADADDDEKKTN
ncbi:hypothetical protein N7541_011867 [Penicillium brevicompactum]|uniref:Glycosylphosphatidylinositol anchor biosynthesis protein 11 n=1 Tax=Penicillium brevicompactum TaxID=5074 RepID=A0A9W9QX51_PENBR|nr:hypothetical protein N7541_011867 [Penicillium brevicompactum]